jgi:hypothetical protein
LPCLQFNFNGKSFDQGPKFVQRPREERLVMRRAICWMARLSHEAENSQDRADL